MLKRLFISTTGRQISLAVVEKELAKSIPIKQKGLEDIPRPSENLSHAVESHIALYFRALNGDEPDAGLYTDFGRGGASSHSGNAKSYIGKSNKSCSHFGFKPKYLAKKDQRVEHFNKSC